MEDFSHLRKAGGKDDEREALLSEGHQHSPTEAKECLDTMKEISTLIANVSLWATNLLIYYII